MAIVLAYYLKEDLRQIWQQPDKATARRVFDDWLARADATGIPMLQQFTTTMREHRRDILAYYDYPSRPDRWKEPTRKSNP